MRKIVSSAALALDVEPASYGRTTRAWPGGRRLVAGILLALALLAAWSGEARAQDTPSADLSVSKSGPATAPPGEAFDYALTVTNNGPDAAEAVELSDPLPPGTEFVSLTQNSGPPFTCSTPAVGAGGAVTCTTAALPSGTVSVFTLVVRATGEGTFTNTATVTGATGDPDPGDNSSSASTTVDEPEPGTLRFDAATYSVDEDAGTAAVTVVRGGGSSGAVSVDYATSDGTATAGSDYTATSGTLEFADGQTTRTFSVPITADDRDEPDETVNLTLSNPQGGATLGARRNAVLTIEDASPTPPAEERECTIRGTKGKDALQGTNGRDVICGMGGADVIQALDGNDTILGGGGADVIQGGNGDDTLKGQNGNDTLQGQDGDDELYGGQGRDVLQGGSGRDVTQQ